MGNLRKKSFKDMLFENRFLFLSFLCSAAIMMVAFIAFGLFPFGRITILRMDLYHQYGPLFSELYDRVTTGGSLLYSWNSGLGGSFLGNYFNYLSSPIGFIVVLLAGNKNVPEAIAVMVLIKAALSALTFSLFLKKSLHKSGYVSVGFSVFYSFCGWFIAYYWNVMWIDAMVLLPVVALGIERIIDNGKPYIYIFALALTMFSNYYMSYMMCIFAVLYFIVYFTSNYSAKDMNNFFKAGTLFAFASVLSACLIAFALLPTYSILQECSATSGTMPKTTSLYFSIFDFIANHLSAVEPTIRSSGDDVLPNVYCGLFTIMLVPLYLFTKSVSVKEKVINLSLLGIFFISFNLNVLNYIWHGFHFPNDLPYRQSFMYSFLLLIIAFKTFIRLKEIPNRMIVGSFLGTAVLIILAEELKSKNVDSSTVFWSIFFAVIYTVVMIILKDKKYQTTAVSVLLLCCMCSEALICDTGKYSMDQPKENYAGDYDSFKEVKKYIDDYEEKPFYRMELSYLRTRMDPSWYNYNGISTFSSMAYENVSSLHRKLGMYGNNINSYTYYPQTAIYNSMFGLSYLVNNTDTDSFKDSVLYSNIHSNDKFTAYQNNYSLPLAFCAGTTLTDWQYESSNPFFVQNDLFERATGVSNAMVRLDPYNIYNSNMDSFIQPLDSNTFPFRKTSELDGKSVFSYTAKEAAEVYLYVSTGEGNDSGTMTVTTGTQTITQDLSKGYILNIGQLNIGEDFTVEIPFKKENGTLTIYCYYLNIYNFVRGYQKASMTSLKYYEVTDTLVSGTFSADEDSVLFTSIPYDTGWKIAIDGERVNKDDIIKIGNALLGIKVSQGNHSLVMKYVPKGLYLGLIISGCALVLTLILAVICIVLKRKNKLYRSFKPVDNSFDCEPFLPDIIENIDETENSQFKVPVMLPIREVIEPPLIYDMNSDLTVTAGEEAAITVEEQTVVPEDISKSDNAEADETKENVESERKVNEEKSDESSDYFSKDIENDYIQEIKKELSEDLERQEFEKFFGHNDKSE